MRDVFAAGYIVARSRLAPPSSDAPIARLCMSCGVPLDDYTRDLIAGPDLVRLSHGWCNACADHAMEEAES